MLLDSKIDQYLLQGERSVLDNYCLFRVRCRFSLLSRISCTSSESLRCKHYVFDYILITSRPQRCGMLI